MQNQVNQEAEIESNNFSDENRAGVTIEDYQSLEFSTKEESIWDSILKENMSNTQKEEEENNQQAKTYAKDSTLEQDVSGGELLILGGKKYRKEVLRIIASLAEKSKTGRAMLEKLFNSGDCLIITENEEVGNELGSRKETNGVKIALMTFNLNAKEEKNNAGATLDKENGQGDKKLSNSPEITFAHELQHFLDFSDGIEYEDFQNETEMTTEESFDGFDEIKVNRIGGSEVSAVDTENKVRAEMGYPLRTHYGGMDVFNKEISKDKKWFKDKGIQFESYYLKDKKNPTNYEEYAKNNTSLEEEHPELLEEQEIIKQVSLGKLSPKLAVLWAASKGIKLEDEMMLKNYGFPNSEFKHKGEYAGTSSLKSSK